MIMSVIVENPEKALTLLDEIEAGEPGRMPGYRVDLFRSMCYEGLREYSLMEKYARRTLESDSVAMRPWLQVQALSLLCDARTYFGDYEEALRTASHIRDIARREGKRTAEIGSLLTIARINFGMGERDRAYEYLEKAIEPDINSRDVRVLANVTYALGLKITELYNDGLFREALAECDRRLSVIDRIDRIGGSPDGFTDQQRAYAFAQKATAAWLMGQSALADKSYSDFCLTEYGRTAQGRSYIVPYLVLSGNFRHALELSSENEAFCRLRGDTVNRDYLGILINMAMSNEGLGNYRESALIRKKAMAVQDSIYLRETRSRAQELNALFHLNDRELELNRAKADAHERKIMLFSAAGLLFLMLVIIAVLWRQYRTSLNRNRIAARQIDELSAQRSRIVSEADNADDAGHEGASSSDYNDFVIMVNKLVEEKLFLQPNFNRASIAAHTGLSRARVIQLIQDFGNCTPNDFINRLKVDYSIRLIREHPEWTIDAIAEEAGYVSRSSYYQNFRKFYGLTPSQYRRQRSGS